jgi:hypothetical protein
MSIDLQRYPISDLERAEARALVERCRRELAAVGYCELPGFLTPAGLTELAREAALLAPLAHRHSGASSPYLEIPSPDWPPGHPRLTFGPYSLGAVAYDLIPENAKLRALYQNEALIGFLARCLGVERLYRYADPLGACNVAVMGNGDELEWHFDQTDFVVSIALQSPEGGGEFECVPSIRTASDENYEAVAAILAGATEKVARLPFRPGTLLLFQGRCALHRVAPVRGARDRLVALLGYDTRPGTISSELLQEARYGRVRRM